MKILLWLPLLILIGCNNQSQKLESNKVLIHKFAEAINNANWDAFDEILTENFTRHCQATPDVNIQTREDFIKLQKSFIESIPDQNMAIEMVLAEGDMVAAYGIYTGTLTGPMGDFPATGKAAEINCPTFFRIEEGRIAEIWVEWDNIAFLTQLGLFPPPSKNVEEG